MRIKINEVVDKIQNEFSIVYIHFKEFQQNPVYSQYWNKCIDAIEDQELLSHIIFCNDLFNIPPVKTFLMFYEKDFIKITNKEDAELEVYVKKSIGAFFGMVFKYIFGYQTQKSTTISLNKMFRVSTATYFSNPKEPIKVER